VPVSIKKEEDEKNLKQRAIAFRVKAQTASAFADKPRYFLRAIARLIHCYILLYAMLCISEESKEKNRSTS